MDACACEHTTDGLQHPAGFDSNGTARRCGSDAGASRKSGKLDELFEVIVRVARRIPIERLG